MKTCTKCHIEKDESEFTKNSRSKDGIAYNCKRCISIISKGAYTKHRDIITQRNKKWRGENKSKINSRRREFKKANIDRFKEESRNYAHNNEKLKKIKRDWEKKERECMSDYYIRQMLRKADGIITNNPEAIELKRNILKLKRELCNKQSQPM